MYMVVHFFYSELTLDETKWTGLKFVFYTKCNHLRLMTTCEKYISRYGEFWQCSSKLVSQIYLTIKHMYPAMKPFPNEGSYLSS